jgi:hypothetical protein
VKDLLQAFTEVAVLEYDPARSQAENDELRRRADAYREALRIAYFRAEMCGPDAERHFHGGGDRCQCGALPNASWAGDSFLRVVPAHETDQPSAEDEGKPPNRGSV